MAVKRILSMGRPKDREKLSALCDTVNLEENEEHNKKIVQDLKDTITERQIEGGLAAPQIGYTERVFVLNYGNGNLKAYFNPVVRASKPGLQLSEEKCPSLPRKTYLRLRSPEVTVTYQTPEGEVTAETFIGTASIVVQELSDHLNGILLSDLGMEVDKDFDEATDEERGEVVELYIGSLMSREKSLKEEIENDETMKQIVDAGRFMTEVAQGKTKIKVQHRKKVTKTIKDKETGEEKEVEVLVDVDEEGNEETDGGI